MELEILDYQGLARKCCIEDEDKEVEEYGPLKACRKLSPLEPPMKLQEYLMLERDQGKYVMYYAAILKASAALQKSVQYTCVTNRQRFMYLIAGAGLGRLATYCLEASKELQLDAQVHVIDANPLAVEFVKNALKNDIEKGLVVVHPPFTMFPTQIQEDLCASLQGLRFNIVVSEFLGCFGDDEFLPELTSTLNQLLLNKSQGIMIPKSWECYVVPICRLLRDFKQNKKALEASYVMDLPDDCIILAEPKEIWNGDCDEAKRTYAGMVVFKVSESVWCRKDGQLRKRTIKEAMQVTSCDNLVTHGFIGFFTSILYDDVIIDSRHTSKDRNCFHWGAYFFPLKESFAVNIGEQFVFQLTRNKRRCKNGIKLWYEWQSYKSITRGKDKKIGEKLVQRYMHNRNGHQDFVMLNRF